MEKYKPFKQRRDTSGSLRGIAASTYIQTDCGLLEASDIVAGMKVQLADGTFSRVISANTYLNDTRRVKIDTGIGEMSVCPDAYLTCSHAMCELYFGLSEVIYPVKSIVGYDRAFSWQPPTTLCECVRLDLEQVGWVQINGLNVCSAPSLSDSEQGAWFWGDGLNELSSSGRLLLTPEETRLLGSFRCAASVVVPMPRVASAHPLRLSVR